MADVIKRVRVELGDTGAPFLDSFLGTGTLTMYDLTEFNIWDVSATWIKDQIPVTLVADTDYSLNTQEGRVYLLPAVGALPQGDKLLVSGKSGGLFSDDELEMFVNDSVLQHTKGRETVERYRDTNGRQVMAGHTVHRGDLVRYSLDVPLSREINAQANAIGKSGLHDD